MNALPDGGPIDTADLVKQLGDLKARLGEVEAKIGNGEVDRLSIVVFSGSLDKQIAAFTIATAAAASGMEAELFFTFWGFSALRHPKKSSQEKKSFWSTMFGWMLPRGTKQLPLSQMQMGGAGSVLIRKIMSDHKFASLENLLAVAAELNVTIFACDMSMQVMGFAMDELIDYPNLQRCGAATFVERASKAKVTLFI